MVCSNNVYILYRFPGITTFTAYISTLAERLNSN